MSGGVIILTNELLLSIYLLCYDFTWEKILAVFTRLIIQPIYQRIARSSIIRLLVNRYSLEQVYGFQEFRSTLNPHFRL